MNVGGGWGEYLIGGRRGKETAEEEKVVDVLKPREAVADGWWQGLTEITRHILRTEKLGGHPIRN